MEKETAHWGREGEVDYCFKLAELSKEEQATFIAAIKSELKDSERVSIKENVPCQNKRKKK